MKLLVVKPRQLLLRITRCLLMAAPILSLVSLPAFAAPPSPGTTSSTTNVGIDFNWASGPNGYSASYIASSGTSGASLDNCRGAVTPSTSACNFAFSYEIGGVAQTAVTSGGIYDTWDGTCEDNPSGSEPLTLSNCFNSGPWGQIFMASATGTLSNFTMPMTCLNPAGSAITNLQASIYLVNPNGSSLPANPIATIPVNLGSCPTLTSWTGHTFTSADFAPILLNFSGVTLTAGNFYGVYLTPAFTLSLPSGSVNSATVYPASSPNATFTFTLTPPYSTFTNAVTFTATGLPSGASVTCSHNSIAAGASQTTVTMTITVPPTPIALLHRGGSAGMLAYCLPLFPIFGLCFFRRSARTRYLGIVGMVLLAVSMTAFIGCGGSNYTATSTSTVTFTATSGGVSQSSQVTLVVN